MDDADALLDVCATLEVVGLLGGLAPVPWGTLDVLLPEGNEALNVELLETFGTDEDETALVVKFVSKDATLVGGIDCRFPVSIGQGRGDIRAVLEIECPFRVSQVFRNNQNRYPALQHVQTRT